MTSNHPPPNRISSVPVSRTRLSTLFQKLQLLPQVHGPPSAHSSSNTTSHPQDASDHLPRHFRQRCHQSWLPQCQVRFAHASSAVPVCNQVVMTYSILQIQTVPLSWKAALDELKISTNDANTVSSVEVVQQFDYFFAVPGRKRWFC